MYSAQQQKEELITGKLHPEQERTLIIVWLHLSNHVIQ